MPNPIVSDPFEDLIALHNATTIMVRQNPATGKFYWITPDEHASFEEYDTIMEAFKNGRDTVEPEFDKFANEALILMPAIVKALDALRSIRDYNKEFGELEDFETQVAKITAKAQDALNNF